MQELREEGYLKEECQILFLTVYCPTTCKGGFVQKTHLPHVRMSCKNEFGQKHVV